MQHDLCVDIPTQSTPSIKKNEMTSPFVSVSCRKSKTKFIFDDHEGETKYVFS